MCLIGRSVSHSTVLQLSPSAISGIINHWQTFTSARHLRQTSYSHFLSVNPRQILHRCARGSAVKCKNFSWLPYPMHAPPKTQPARRRNRTFTGCLTCRSRKVKCTAGPFPCGNCRRLRLECVSPFAKNLRSVDPTRGKRCTSLPGMSAQHTPFHVAIDRLIPPIPITEDDTTTSVSERPAVSFPFESHDVTRSTSSDWITKDDVVDPPSLEVLENAGLIGGTAFEHPLSLDGMSLDNTNRDLVTLLSTEGAFTWPGPVLGPSWHSTRLDVESSYGHPNTNISTGALEGLNKLTPISPVDSAVELLTWPAEESNSDHALNLTFLESLESPPYWVGDHMGGYSETARPPSRSLDVTARSPRTVCFDSIMSAASGVSSSPVIPSAEIEASILQHYASHLSTSVSVKNPRWNIFACLFDVSSRASRSPVRSSLVAWAGIHLSMQQKDAPELAMKHYAAASAEILTLSDNLTKQNSGSLKPSESVHLSSQARMLLAASFFLCHCDILTCNLTGFRLHIDALKRLFGLFWYLITDVLSGIDYRLLLWMAYLDVRSRAFRTAISRPSQPAWIDETLLDIVAEKESLRSIYLKSRSYLREGFGEGYPSHELRGDMLQDPINIRFLEAMSLLSRIISLEGAKYCNTTTEIGQVARRTADNEAQRLQSELSDLRNVCEPL